MRLAVGDPVTVLRKGYRNRTGTIQAIQESFVRVMLDDTRKWMWCLPDEVCLVTAPEPQPSRVRHDYTPQTAPQGIRVIPKGEFLTRDGSWVTETLTEYLERIGWR